EYLKNRGISGKTAKEFSIGYAPPDWDHLWQRLGQGEHKQKQLTLSGMLIENEDGKRYDRFRNRIMFPIRDRRGRTIGFGGRALGDGKPKYLNSPETPLFHKGKELYGLFEAQQALRKITRLLVVEGYMDVTSLAEHGIRYAVATLGTATTHEHLSLLFRTTDKIVFCFDGDRAGREAAWKALQVALPTVHEGKQINFMFLPDGEDPDSLVQKEGREQFESRINQAQPLSEFIFDRLSQDVDTSTIDGRARLTELTRNILSQLPGGVFKHMLTERLAKIIDVDSKRLTAFITPHEHTKHAKYNRKNKKQLTPVSFMIALLLQQPRLSVLAHDFEASPDMEVPGLHLLMELLELLRKKPNLQTGALLEHWRDQEASHHLFKLAKWQFPLAKEHMESEFQGALKQLKTKLNEQMTEQLLKKERETGLNDTEKAQLRHLLTRGTSIDNDHPT
ncbi:MAG TPA: DNA primase, partial [Gammaproteobacteria bacterium]|nr:DNA primase [Gammaproteobacteria bacterium]